MRTWLVTGATGLLGANVPLGLGSDDACVALVRSHKQPLSYEHVTVADLLDDEAIKKVVGEVKPNVVLNCAALATHRDCESDPNLARALNARAAGVLASATSAVGAAFVQISTDAVFDGASGHYAESDTPHPFSVYGATKLEGEEAVLAAHPSALVARTNFFGWSPSGSRSILEYFVSSMRAGRDTPGFTDFTVTSLYVADLVFLLGQMVTAGHSGIVNVASVDEMTKLEFGLEVASTFGLDKGLLQPMSAEAGHSMSSSRDLSLDTSLLSNLLGQAPPTQRSGIQRAYDDEAIVPALIRL